MRTMLTERQYGSYIEPPKDAFFSRKVGHYPPEQVEDELLSQKPKLH